jgi:hypothetical protein
MRVFRVGEAEGGLRRSRGGAGCDMTQVVQRTATRRACEILTLGRTVDRQQERVCCRRARLMRALEWKWRAFARRRCSETETLVSSPREMRKRQRPSGSRVPSSSCDRLVTFFHTLGDPGRLVNAESGTMVTLVRFPAPTTGGRLPPRATQPPGRAPREVVSSTASRLCQPPDPVFEVAQGSVLGFAGFSGSVPNAALILIALCRRSLSL